LPIKHKLWRFCADERGAAAIIFALVLTMLLGFVALGVDLSSLYFQQKTLQTRADLAAVSAVKNLHDSPADWALTTLDGNGLDPSTMTSITYARYQRDASLTPDARLTDRNLEDDDVNAATVQLHQASPLYFARTFLSQDSTRLGARATAARFDLASFSLGSRLLSLNEGLLNALLSEATGSNISLTLLDYQALADADIDLLTFSDALATRAGLTALTYADLLSSDIELPHVAGALLDTGAVAGSTAVLQAVLNSGASALLDAEKLIGVEGGNVAAQLEDVLPTVTVSVLDVLMSSVDVITADRYIDTSLNLAIPDLTATRLQLVVGERPAWIMFGEKGATAHTAQVRMKLDLTLSTDILSGVATTLDIVDIEVPIYLEIASATATLTEIDCGAADAEPLVTFDTGIDPLTGETGTHVAELFLGNFPAPDFADNTTPLSTDNLTHAKLLGLNINVSILLSVGADVMIKSHAAIGVSESLQTQFTRAEQGQTKTFGSESLLSSGVSTLLADADIRLDASVGLLSTLVTSILSLVTNLLEPLPALILVPLDAVLDSILETLGIGIGEADLTLHAAHCGQIMLVR
jgi:uncharacterized membrane protein